jgi:hypothetical protein
MSDVMQALPKDSPIMKAWDEYVASPEFANSKRWAEAITVVAKDDQQVVAHPHLEGSLWAAFTAGIRAGQTIAA